MLKAVPRVKKGDIAAAAAVTVAALAAFMLFGRSSGTTVVIKQDSKVIYRASLYTDNTVELDGNTVVIKGGKVKMQSAGCKNQICVKTGEISKKGESIICLPNRVIAEIE